MASDGCGRDGFRLISEGGHWESNCALLSVWATQIQLFFLLEGCDSSEEGKDLGGQGSKYDKDAHEIPKSSIKVIAKSFVKLLKVKIHGGWEDFQMAREMAR